MATTPDHFTNLSVAALVFTVMATAGLAEQNPAAPLPPTNATVTITVGETESSALVQPMISADTAPSGWSDIKDTTTGNRAQFLAGLQRMEAKVNAEFNELTAKRSALKNTTMARELDQALAELSNARFSLKTTREFLSRATPQTWEQMKAKVGLAWTKSQEAYAKVQVHTTS